MKSSMNPFKTKSQIRDSQMGLEKVKWAYFGVYLSQNVESCKKFNEKAQTANSSVLARGRRPRKELFAENMDN